MIKKSNQNLPEKAKIGSWLSGLRINPDKLFFYLLVLFIPTQLGRHFWPEFSYLYGIRIDYLSPTLYLTDILIFLILFFWILKQKKHIYKKLKLFIAKRKILLVFILSLLIGAISAKNQLSGFYGILKLIEYIALGFYVKTEINKKEFLKILFLLSIGIIFESALAILQFLNHGSIGGVLYFLGERTFNSQTPQIANASINGELVLRPYGTFSHPNVLAGYLVISMTAVILSFNFFISKKSKQISSLFKSIYFFTFLIGTIGLFLTLSRVCIMLWIITLLAVLFIKLNNKRKYIKYYFIISLLIFALIIYLFPVIYFRFSSLNLLDNSILQRKDLILYSLQVISKNYLFGVGLNNFIVNLAQIPVRSGQVFFIQPVHNIYLLIFAETGIVGISFFFWFIIKSFNKLFINFKYKVKSLNQSPFILAVVLLQIITIGLSDHYFITLQQGQLLFTLFFSIVWSKIVN